MQETHAGSEPVDVEGRSRNGLGIALHAFLLLVAVVTPFQIIAPAVLLSAGLRHGRKAAIMTLAIATAIVVLGALGADAGGRPTAMSVAGLLLFQIGIPALVLLRSYELNFSGGRALVVALGVAVLGVFIVETGISAAFEHSPFRALSTQTREIFDQVITSSGNVSISSREAMKSVMDAIVNRFLPALVVCNTALMLVCSMVFVPRLRKDPAAEEFRLRNLHLPDTLLIGFVISGLSPLADGAIRDVGFNVLAVVIFLYWLQGLAVARMILTRSALRFFSSTPAFLLLAVLAFSWIGSIAAVALTGLFDSFFDFRKYKRKEDSDESDLDG